MKTAELVIAVNTVWVVVAAILVMFMQAGFAFLEAGLTRMKNAGHIAGKNVLIFGICSLVYWAVGFGLAFGDGNAIVGTSGFFPSADDLLGDRHGAVQLLRLDSSRRRLSLRGRLRRRLARDRLGRHGRAREALGLLRLRRRLHRHLLRRLALGLAQRRLALRPRHAGLRRLDGRPLPGRARCARGGAPPRPQNRQVRHRWQGKPDPRPQHAFAVLGTIILWFGWFGFNPGSTLGVVTGDRIGYFAYVALTTNLAAAAGALGGIATAWVVLKSRTSR